jgi:hypothetical protein
VTTKRRIATVLAVSAATVGGVAAAVGPATEARAATATSAAVAPSATSAVVAAAKNDGHGGLTFEQVNKLIRRAEDLRGAPCSISNLAHAGVIASNAHRIIERTSKHIQQTEDQIKALDKAIARDRYRLAHYRPNGVGLSKSALRHRIQVNERVRDGKVEDLEDFWYLEKSGAQGVVDELHDHFLKRCHR